MGEAYKGKIRKLQGYCWFHEFFLKSYNWGWPGVGCLLNKDGWGLKGFTARGHLETIRLQLSVALLSTSGAVLTPGTAQGKFKSSVEVGPSLSPDPPWPPDSIFVCLI